MSLTNRSHKFTRLASSVARDHTTTQSARPKHVLISGAGIAGPTLAFWLHKYGIKTTLVERAPDLRTAGQTIDVRGAAWKVVEQMGIADAIRAKATHEVGVHFVDESDRPQVSFLNEGKGGLIVAEIEVPRFSFCEVLYEATKDHTEYIFGNSIAAIEEHHDRARVSFVDGPARDFDVVVLADGYASRTRRPIFGPDEQFVKPLGQYSGYFSIPFRESDGDYSRWFNAPGGRWIWIRPDKPNGVTRAFLSYMTPANGFEKLPPAEQKAKFRELFQDVKWPHSKRVLDGMDTCSDFYVQLVAQVQMDTWSKGRVALVGDAAYCPSPLSGNGVYAAILGSYILAGELAKHEDHVEAFKSYEAVFRPCMKDIQDTLPTSLVAPQTSFGIWARNRLLLSLISLILRTGIKLLVEPFTRDTYQPPNYSEFLVSPKP